MSQPTVISKNICQIPFLSCHCYEWVYSTSDTAEEDIFINMKNILQANYSCRPDVIFNILFCIFYQRKPDEIIHY